MVEQIEWEPLALSLLNLMDKCEIDSEEVTCPIAANVFNGVEMALSVILVMGDTTLLSKSNANEFPGFLTKIRSKQHFAACLRHLSFQYREFSSESSLHMVLSHSLFPIICSKFLEKFPHSPPH